MFSCFRGLLIAFALSTASCGAPLMKLPVGPGMPAADAVDALQQATAVCRGIRTLTAEVAVSGKVIGRRFRARLSAGVAAPASARIEAVAPFGAPYFILASNNDDTTLLQPRDERVLQHARSVDVLDAVAGVPLSAGDLQTVLTGCVPAMSRPQGLALGGDWRRLTDDAGRTVYLHRGGAVQPWQLVLVSARGPTDSPTASGLVGWRVEYRDWLNGLPRAMRITSHGADDLDQGSFFDLTLALSQVETNVPLGPDVFHVDIPRGAQPITLDELRHARTGVRKN